jgi:hypothetical protein
MLHERVDQTKLKCAQTGDLFYLPGEGINWISYAIIPNLRGLREPHNAQRDFLGRRLYESQTFGRPFRCKLNIYADILAAT